MGLEVNDKDLEELVDDHKPKLTIEEHQHLYIQQQEEVAEEVVGGKSSISSAEIN